MPASKTPAGHRPSPGGSASCAACRVGAAPCWRDIRQLPAPGPTVHSACPRAVRPRREPHGASPVQPRRASGRLAARRAALTVPPGASPRTRLVHSGGSRRDYPPAACRASASILCSRPRRWLVAASRTTSLLLLLRPSAAPPKYLTPKSNPQKTFPGSSTETCAETSRPAPCPGISTLPWGYRHVLPHARFSHTAPPAARPLFTHCTGRNQDWQQIWVTFSRSPTDLDLSHCKFTVVPVHVHSLDSPGRL
eukprot:SAG25_NODE_144_length_14010_cov_17.620300_2_plen_251_part_00